MDHASSPNFRDGLFARMSPAARHALQKTLSQRHQTQATDSQNTRALKKLKGGGERDRGEGGTQDERQGRTKKSQGGGGERDRGARDGRKQEGRKEEEGEEEWKEERGGREGEEERRKREREREREEERGRIDR